MTTEQELQHYKKVLERIRDWARTSKGSCDILRGFARRGLESVDKGCIDCKFTPLDLTCAECIRNPNLSDEKKRFDYFKTK